jgi:hypothetical protein
MSDAALVSLERTFDYMATLVVTSQRPLGISSSQLTDRRKVAQQMRELEDVEEQLTMFKTDRVELQKKKKVVHTTCDTECAGAWSHREGGNTGEN